MPFPGTVEEVPMDDAEQYWSPNELSKKLRVSPETVRRALRNKTIAGIRVGRQWRIPDSEYRRVLERGLASDEHD
jgi:excisionase family DNA binding protein